MLLGQGTESLDHYDTDSKVRQISFQIPALPLSHSAFMPPSSHLENEALYEIALTSG